MRKIIPAMGKNRDPYIFMCGGRYLRCFSRGGNQIVVEAADRPDGFASAQGTVVYTAEEGTAFSKEYWAPEIHILDGTCWLYVACDDGDNHNHRMVVLGNDSKDPLSPYRLRGKLSAPTDRWAIDGTVMRCGEKLYFVWSGWEGSVNTAQNLYIAGMKSPYELSCDRVLLSRPEYDWEKRGATGQPESPFINEGPCAFYADGATYLAYSASGSWCEDYCIGLMKLVGSDPMNPADWKKLPHPILGRTDQAKGCGHCSILNENGRLTMFFHAWDQSETAIRWDTVSTWAAELTINKGEIKIL